MLQNSFGEKSGNAQGDFIPDLYTDLIKVRIPNESNHLDFKGLPSVLLKINSTIKT
jgi:hypothetical protein